MIILRSHQDITDHKVKIGDILAWGETRRSPDNWVIVAFAGIKYGYLVTHEELRIVNDNGHFETWTFGGPNSEHEEGWEVILVNKGVGPFFFVGSGLFNFHVKERTSDFHCY